MEGQLNFFEMNMELEFIQVDSDGIFGIFNHFFIPSNLIEMSEEFIRAGGGSKNLTVPTVSYQIICYQLWSDSKMHPKAIIDK